MGGQAIGYALFFGFYSSWKGPGIFLEDIFVPGSVSRSRDREERFCSRLLVLPSGKAAMAFAGKFWVGMSRQSKFYKPLGGEFLDDLSKCSCNHAAEWTRGRIAEHAGVHTQRR